MPAIPSDLLHRLYEALLRCGPFDSDPALRSLFVDARLSVWRDLLPEAGSRAERVQAVVAALSARANVDGENALVLLLRALAEATPPGDACRGELALLGEELAAALRADVPASAAAPLPTPVAPTAFDQRGQQVGAQVNVSGDYYAPQRGITITGDGNAIGNGNVIHIEKGTERAAAASPVDLPALRARLQRRDAVEIESLCLDYFPAVYDKFARGMQRGELINLLLDHCRRNPGDGAKLAALLG